MGIPANPYPGWWASPDRDENGDPIRRTYTQEPPEELPEWYQEDQWNYQYFEKEENWYDDSSNFHDNPFEERESPREHSPAKDTREDCLLQNSPVHGTFHEEDGTFHETHLRMGASHSIVTPIHLQVEIEILSRYYQRLLIYDSRPRSVDCLS